ncbi:MAG: hypothetical protein F4X77_00185 [Acidobacteriia bacterium]|nr:hypothetical protein [Terriglobia bacterium]
MPTSETGGPDSRPARREALEAGLLWALALVTTVGLSSWLGSADPASVGGVPGWAAYGVFGPWLLFFLLHLRFCRRRS